MQHHLDGVLQKLAVFFHPDRRRLQHENVIAALFGREAKLKRPRFFCSGLPRGLDQFVCQVDAPTIRAENKETLWLRCIEELMLEGMTPLVSEGERFPFFRRGALRQ